MTFRIAIDTGGTFTDSISVDERGHLVSTKTLTLPKDLAQGTIHAIEALAKQNHPASNSSTLHCNPHRTREHAPPHQPNTRVRRPWPQELSLE